MPIPEVRPYERQIDYLNRCVPIMMEKDGLDRAQSAAICYATWRDK